MSGQVWAVAGGKGGVGKTTTVAALGRAFVERDRQVAVLDADLGMGNLPEALGANSDAGVGGDLH
ncbi:septum site-determining protein MinD, partial [Halobacteriales archaeon QH_10_67_13]